MAFLAFEGSWRIVRREGDIDAFMKASGIGFLKRKALSMLSPTNIVNLSSPEHEPGKSLALTIIAAGQTMVKPVIVLDGNSTSEETSPVGDLLEVKGWWEGDKLIVEKKRQVDGSVTRETRTLEGDIMRNHIERVDNPEVWFAQIFERA